MVEIYKIIRGSHAYGTNIETSDTDYSRVHITDFNTLLGLKKNYVEQINLTDDDVSYELGRFIELCAKGNPNMLELLFTEQKFIIHKHPIMDIILDNKQKFISKLCNGTFAGYARTQFKKADGLDKLYKWELDDKNKGFTERKTPIDFCYVLENNKSEVFSDFISRKNLKQEFFGLSSIPHIKNQYNMFYSEDPQIKYRGVIAEDSNTIRLSNIPKNTESIGVLYFNLEAYQHHCSQYKRYTEWLEKRNTNRYTWDINNNMYDMKNLMHCKRLIDVAYEIAETKSFTVFRPNHQELIDIRRGDIDIKKLMDDIVTKLNDIDRLFKQSDLPEKVDEEFINNLLIETRKQFYKL